MSDESFKKGMAGKFVECHPLPNDPLVIEKRHRASCLMQPTPRCHTCPNSSFTLFFEEPEVRVQLVQCPKWSNAAARLRGDAPSSYVTTEVATCESRPFEFCPSCPSVENLEELELEKSNVGWYTIWQRALKLASAEIDDGGG